MLRNLARHLERRGCETAAWRREVDCPELDSTDPDARVPVATMRKAWRAAVALTGSPSLALEVGGDYSCSTLGIFGHLFSHSHTLGEAFDGVCRYLVFISGGMTKISLETTPETARLVGRNHDPDPEIWPTVVARTFAGVHAIARDETGGRFRVERTEWDHPAPGHRESYERAFGARAFFEAKACALVFPRPLLALPLLHRNAELRSFFGQRLQRHTAALEQPPTVRAHLRQILPGLIDRFAISAGDAARTMHTSLRTLHRSLAREQTTFLEELDHVRRERCLWLMQECRQPLENVAFACGYADASGFHRAFRRWTGVAPREYRAARLGLTLDAPTESGS